PIILAELKRPGFAQFLQAELNKAGHGGTGLHIIEDPAQATGGPGVWMLARKDLLAIAPEGSAFQFGSGAFTRTPFGGRVADAYRSGVGILFSADPERIMKNVPANAPPGVNSIRNILVEHKETGGRTDTRMSVGFAGQRQGIFSWLAAPA